MSFSGVGVESRYVIEGLVKTGKYSFRCFGGAVKHANYDTVVVNNDFVIKPVDGFGTPEMLRMTLATEKPDAVVLFTDPRFFEWLLSMEDEIHQICPILWWNIWDNRPTPIFNKWIYKSVDFLNCISYLTYEMLKEITPDKVDFLPHAIPEEIFRPLKENEVKEYKRQLLGSDRVNHFVGLWVARNAKRKRPNDLLWAWKLFLDKLQNKYGHKNATLLMHTDPLDSEGPNLFATTEYFNLQDNIFFSKERLDFDKINVLHNISDFGINLSYNEGFGIPVLESLQCGKPVIALKTGGITRQIVNHADGTENGIALPVEFQTLVGSQSVPYILEDYASVETTANAIFDMYEWGEEKRKKVGERAREYVLENFSIKKMIEKWDISLEREVEKYNKDYKSWQLLEM